MHFLRKTRKSGKNNRRICALQASINHMYYLCQAHIRSAHEFWLFFLPRIRNGRETQSINPHLNEITIIHTYIKYYHKTNYKTWFIVYEIQIFRNLNFRSLFTRIESQDRKFYHFFLLTFCSTKNLNKQKCIQYIEYMLVFVFL